MSRKERKYNCKSFINTSFPQWVQFFPVSLVGPVVGVSSSSLTSPNPDPCHPQRSVTTVKRVKGSYLVSTGKRTGLGGMVPFKIEWVNSGMLRRINWTRWFGMDNLKRFWQDKWHWRMMAWILRNKGSQVGEEITSSCNRGCLLPLYYAFHGKVRNLQSSSSSWYCLRIWRISGQRPGGPTHFLFPLEMIPCLCLVMKPLSATGTMFPSKLLEDLKYGTSMGYINESEPWWLDSGLK